MQIQSRSVSSAAAHWKAPATLPASTPGAASTRRHGGDGFEAVVGNRRSSGGDGTAESLGSALRMEAQARIQATVGSPARAASRSGDARTFGTLGSVQRAVSFEFRQVRSELRELRTGDLGAAERQDLRQTRRELRQVEREFTRELRALSRDALSGGSFDGEASDGEASDGEEGLLGTVQDSFDRLVGRLTDLVQGDLAASPAPAAVDVTTLAEAPPAEFSEVLRDTLADFAERFEAFIERLSASLSAGAPLPRGAQQEELSGEGPRPVGEQVVATYTQFRFELSVEVSGSLLDLAS